MKKKFTPAPWEVFMDGDTKPGIVNNNIMAGDVVMFGYEGEQCGVLGRSKEEAMANANLIAAAPELLAHLEALIAGEQFISFYHMDMSDKEATQGAQYRQVFERAKEIIKKAYGEQ